MDLQGTAIGFEILTLRHFRIIERADLAMKAFPKIKKAIKYSMLCVE